MSKLSPVCKYFGSRQDPKPICTTSAVLTVAWSQESTELQFARFSLVNLLFTGKEIGKSHLCAVQGQKNQKFKRYNIKNLSQMITFLQH